MSYLIIQGETVISMVERWHFEPNGDLIADSYTTHAAALGSTVVDAGTLPQPFIADAWLWQGGTLVINPSFVPPPTAIPQSITKLQAVLAMHDAGLLTQIEKAVNTAGGTSLILWNHASLFFRNDPLMAKIATAAGLSSAQLDHLFVAASKIVSRS